jgi:hypothetical protein|tara:strand:- start:3271 stop:3510 length:240 start_codon:yes stop_codon:yes gene_type:complete
MDNLNNMVINKEEISNIDLIKLQKMTLLYNALEKGWSIKKSGNCYVFKKKHNNEKEVYLESYLKRFMVENLDINQILTN